MNDPSTTKSIRVLVVDDEPAVLNLVTRVLGQAGYDTVSAPDGPSALTVAQRSGPFDPSTVGSHSSRRDTRHPTSPLRPKPPHEFKLRIDVLDSRRSSTSALGREANFA